MQYDHRHRRQRLGGNDQHQPVRDEQRQVPEQEQSPPPDPVSDGAGGYGQQQEGGRRPERQQGEPLRPDGRTIDLIVAHLKSKLLSFPPGPTGRSRFQPRDEGERARVAAYALYRRVAEAVTVRALADELLAGQGEARQAMVMGDFNDEPEAATTQILLGPPGSELGTPGADQPDRGDKARLWNLAPRIPAAERFSQVFHGRGELIDHLLVSHALLARAIEVHTLRPADVASPHDGLPSMTEDPTSRRDAPASDHAMVFTRLSP